MTNFDFYRSVVIIFKDFSGVKWDPWCGKILVNVIRYDDFKKRKYELDTEFGAIINPKDNTYEVLPIKYHDVYKTSLRYSLYYPPGLFVNEKYIIGYSGITPDLTIYDKKRKFTKVIHIKHKYQREIEPIDTTKLSEKDYLIDHASKNICYLDLCFNPVRKILL